MIKKSHILFFFCILFLLSCSQDIEDDLLDFPEDIVNADEPVFTFTANAGFYNIQAGVSDFYMFTEYEIDDFEVYSFIGRFAKLATCLTNCNESLSFTLRPNNISISTSSPLQNSSLVGAYVYPIEPDIETNNSNSVLLEYTDEEGRVFRTELVEQNQENFFEVFAAQDYIRNENDASTKILRVGFNCTLKHEGSGETIEFTNAEAFIAVAHPE